MRRIAAITLGVAMLATAVTLAPAAWPGVVIGAITLGLAAVGRWPAAATATASVAVITTGIGIHAGPVPLAGTAAEGTLALAYLLAADQAASDPSSSARSWLSCVAPVVAAGAAAAAAVATVAAIKMPASPWLPALGAVAVTAVLITASGTLAVRLPGQAASGEPLSPGSVGQREL